MDRALKYVGLLPQKHASEAMYNMREEAGRDDEEYAGDEQQDWAATVEEVADGLEGDMSWEKIHTMNEAAFGLNDARLARG